VSEALIELTCAVLSGVLCSQATVFNLSMHTWHIAEADIWRI